MRDSGLPSRLTEVHVAGWTIVQAVGDLDAAGAAELITHVGPILTPGAKVALDLRQVQLDPASGPEAIRSLVDTATRAGAQLVSVEADAGRRDLLRSAGVPEVYESLDAALHATSPVLRDAGSPPPEPPLIPASGDAVLVAAEDDIGQADAH